jgi:hypothetical protein
LTRSLLSVVASIALRTLAMIAFPHEGCFF